jgi:type III secretory pathway component EscR
MGAISHEAYKKMREAQKKVERNPYFTDYKKEAKDAEIEYLKKQIEEKESDEYSERFWGY